MEKKKKWGENTNKATVEPNGGIRCAVSNDKRLPGRQKLDSAQILHIGPICLPCRAEEVAIRHLLSDPLTSQMDEPIMGASAGKSQPPVSLSTRHNALVVYLGSWTSMLSLLHRERASLQLLDTGHSLLLLHPYCVSLHFSEDSLYCYQRNF